MPEEGLQRARVDPLVGESKAAAMAQHVRVNPEPEAGRRPKRASICRNPAVLNGAPRSVVATKGETGRCSRLSRRSALSSRPVKGWTAGAPLFTRAT